MGAFEVTDGTFLSFTAALRPRSFGADCWTVDSSTLVYEQTWILSQSALISQIRSLKTNGASVSGRPSVGVTSLIVFRALRLGVRGGIIAERQTTSGQRKRTAGNDVARCGDEYWTEAICDSFYSHKLATYPTIYYFARGVTFPVVEKNKLPCAYINLIKVLRSAEMLCTQGQPTLGYISFSERNQDRQIRWNLVLTCHFKSAPIQKEKKRKTDQVRYNSVNVSQDSVASDLTFEIM